MLNDSIILAPLLLWLVLWIAARRFEKRRREQGAWSESGPIDPTYAPMNPTLGAVGMRGPTIEPGSRGHSFELPSDHQLHLRGPTSAPDPPRARETGHGLNEGV